MAAGDREDALKNIKAILDYNEALKNSLNIEDRIKREMELQASNKLLLLERERLINAAKEEGIALTEEEKELLGDIETSQKNINTELTKEERRRKNINAAVTELNRQLNIGWKFLMESDKVIKNTVLNLGMSGAKAEMMRSSFEQSAGLVARLGGNLEDIQKIMEGYADETGRARALSAEMVKNITLIGRGTGLGIEQAAKLGSQFEIMGFDAKSTMDYVQGIVDTSERMGVNTTKVLKNLNDNFKKLNTYTFTRGSKAMAEMAMNAEKMKVSMESALNIAEATRSLEKVIDLGANLQVMGGEFAKMDPFQWLYISRNEPEKMTEKISEMTRGLFTFKKMSDGTFEKFISPADRDRLANVAESLGIAKEEIFQIAERRLDMDKMNRDMLGMGLSKREKELVQGAAVFNKETMKYQVMLAGHMKDISTLTADQAKSFAKEQSSLEARALEAQTFEDAFKATINKLKSALLPILRGVNAVLIKIRPIVIGFTDIFTKGPAAWAKTAALFLAAGVSIKLAAGYLSHKWEGMLTKMSGFNKVGTATATGVGSGAPASSGARAAGRNAGKGLMRGGAGIGAAALGVGAGIGIAAGGISLLADAMSKLTKDQAENLKSIVKSLSWLMVAGIGAAVVIAGFGAASTAAAGGLLAFGAAMLMVGGGISLATLGIARMAEGIAEMNKSGDGAGKQLRGVATGIGAISLAMGRGGGVALSDLNNSLTKMAKNSPAIDKIGVAFANIKTVLSGSKDDYIAIANAIESISKSNTRGGSAFSGLANILSKPLKVEFADKQVAVVSNITMNIDGYKFHEATNVGGYIRTNYVETKAGLSGKG